MDKQSIAALTFFWLVVGTCLYLGPLHSEPESGTEITCNQEAGCAGK